MRRVAVCLLVAGCAGGPPSSPPVAAPASTLAVPAAALFERGRLVFAEAERRGWTTERCTTAAHAFEVAARASDAPFPRALYMAGLARERCAEPERARRLYVAALAQDPGFCRARSALGLLDVAAGRLPAARETLALAVERDPTCIEGYVNLAAVERRLGHLEEAAAALRRALELEPSSIEALHALAVVRLAQADSDVTMLEVADLVCRQAAEIDPRHAPLYNTWGLVSVQQGHLVEAMRHFERAFTLDRSIVEAFMNYGQIALAFRGFADAERAFRGALRAREGDYDALIGLGVALRGRGLIEESEAQYELALALDPDRPEAWFNLGVLHQDHMAGTVEELTEASRFFEAFLAKAGDAPRYREAIDEVFRCCDGASRDCRPGRLQSIETAIALLRSEDIPACAR